MREDAEFGSGAERAGDGDIAEEDIDGETDQSRRDGKPA